MKASHSKSRWLGITPPPNIEDKVVVYVSSGLFNLAEILYCQGYKNVAAKDETAQIVSDHIPTIYDQKFDGQDGEAAKRMLDLLGPPGGMMEAIAKQKHWLNGKQWQSYIPARDGFNMAIFMQAASTVSFEDVQKQVPELTAEDWKINGSYLLMAVYGYDMFNLISRCNCCIFNGNGITKDSGSVAELGIATSRGFPLIIFQNSLLTPFANLMDNPMVLGATGEFLDVSLYTWTIDDAIKALNAKLQIVYNRNKFGELNYASKNPPAYLPAFWSNVGKNVWNWRYISNNYDEFGRNISKTSDEWNKWWKLGSIGKAYIVGRICVLVKNTQKSFFGTSSTDKHIKNSALISASSLNSQNQNKQNLNVSTNTLFYTNYSLNSSSEKNQHYLNTMIESVKLTSIKHNNILTSTDTHIKVFMNWPVWNLLQECEMLICSWYVNRSMINNTTQCLAITKTLNCPYWAIRTVVFTPNIILTTKPSDFNIKGGSWDENNFTPFKTLRICAQLAWWASMVYWAVSSNIVLSNANDIVVDPGVASIGSIATTLGTPGTVWRNDARLLWNQGMNPVLLSALMPNMSDQSLFVKGGVKGGLLNIPVQSNPSSSLPTNNLEIILQECYNINYTEPPHSPDPNNKKINLALTLANIMLKQQTTNKKWLEFLPDPTKSYKDWGIDQLKFITKCICSTPWNTIYNTSDKDVIYSNMNNCSESLGII
jgi:hypothetical protein